MESVLVDSTWNGLVPNTPGGAQLVENLCKHEGIRSVTVAAYNRSHSWQREFDNGRVYYRDVQSGLRQPVDPLKVAALGLNPMDVKAGW